MQLILAITFQDFVHHLTSTEGLKGIKHKKEKIGKNSKFFQFGGVLRKVKFGHRKKF